MYYRAKKLALNNEMDYHLAAVLVRNKHIVHIGTNSEKTHPKFRRQHDNGEWSNHLHAEMDALRFAKPGDILYVFRFTANGELSMAKPCEFCEQYIKDADIGKVIYSNWDGDLVKVTNLDYL